MRPPCMRDGEWECTTEPLDRAGVDRANETEQMESVMADSIRIARTESHQIRTGSRWSGVTCWMETHSRAW